MLLPDVTDFCVVLTIMARLSLPARDIFHAATGARGVIENAAGNSESMERVWAYEDMLLRFI